MHVRALLCLTVIDVSGVDPIINLEDSPATFSYLGRKASLTPFDRNSKKKKRRRWGVSVDEVESTEGRYFPVRPSSRRLLKVPVGEESEGAE